MKIGDSADFWYDEALRVAAKVFRSFTKNPNGWSERDALTEQWKLAIRRYAGAEPKKKD